MAKRPTLKQIRSLRKIIKKLREQLDEERGIRHDREWRDATETRYDHGAEDRR